MFHGSLAIALQSGGCPTMGLQLCFHDYLYQDPIGLLSSNQFFHWFFLTVFYSWSRTRICSSGCIFKGPRSTQFFPFYYLLVWTHQLVMLLFISDCSEDFSGLTATDLMLQTGIPVNRIGRQEKLRKEVMFCNKELISWDWGSREIPDFELICQATALVFLSCITPKVVKIRYASQYSNADYSYYMIF